MIDKESIKNITEEAVAGTNLFIVDIAVRPGNIINIELDSDQPIGIEDCVNISRFVEAKLDRDAEDFELEVGSSGLSTPFKMPRQYVKNIGNEVEVLTKDGKKLCGILKSADTREFVLTIVKKEKPEGAKKKIDVEEDLHFGYDDVKYTKYLIRFK